MPFKRVPLTFANQWENLTYTLDGEPLEAREYFVIWPDGNRELLNVLKQPEYRTVHDMGQSYQVATYRFLGVIVHNKIEIMVPLEHLKGLLFEPAKIEK